MRERDELEAPCQALGEPALDQQRRRPEQQHLQVHALGAVAVPQALDRFGPVRELLDLVENQHGAFASHLCRAHAGDVPLLLDPDPVPQRGLVGGGEVDGQSGALHDLPREGGLADLPRAGEDLD